MHKIYIIFILITSLGLQAVYAENSHNYSVHNNSAKHKEHESYDSHDKHDGHNKQGDGKAIGKGKAIESVDEVKGFKLSKEAIQILALKFKTVHGAEFKIEKTTLIASKNLKGVYRFRNGYFKFLTVELLKEVDGTYIVKAKGINSGDQIVTKGLGLLRVADVYSTDKSEYGHSH